MQEFKIIYQHLSRKKSDPATYDAMTDFEKRINEELKQGWKLVNVTFNCAINEPSAGYHGFLVREK